MSDRCQFCHNLLSTCRATDDGWIFRCTFCGIYLFVSDEELMS